MPFYRVLQIKEEQFSIDRRETETKGNTVGNHEGRKIIHPSNQTSKRLHVAGTKL